MGYGNVAPAPVISAANADVDVAIKPAAMIVLVKFIDVSIVDEAHWRSHGLPPRTDVVTPTKGGMCNFDPPEKSIFSPKLILSLAGHDTRP
jgi:hypothetical protein